MVLVFDFFMPMKKVPTVTQSSQGEAISAPGAARTGKKVHWSCEANDVVVLLCYW